MYLQGAQLGPHPDDGAAVTLGTGKWGPYVKHASTMASLPKARPSAGSQHRVGLHCARSGAASVPAPVPALILRVRR